MKRGKGEAKQKVADALGQVAEGVSGDLAKATGLTIGYCTMLLRELVQDGKAVRVRHGVYRIARKPTPTLPLAAGKGTREAAQLLQESLATSREIIEHMQAVDRLLKEFKPGNAQAKIEVYLSLQHMLRAVDWMTGVVRPELPRPFGEESSVAVNRALSGSGR